MDSIHLIDDFIPHPHVKDRLLEGLQPLLVDGTVWASYYSKSFIPGKQTHPTLHLHSNFKQLGEDITTQVVRCLGRKMKMVKMWGKWSNGKKDHMNWHNHLPNDYSIVYYLKVPSFMRNGTLFKGDGLFKTKENSLLIFPAYLIHSTPSYFWKGDRYVISADFVGVS